MKWKESVLLSYFDLFYKLLKDTVSNKNLYCNSMQYYQVNRFLF